MIGMGVRTQFTHLKEAMERLYTNMHVIPRPGTCHPLPWAGAGKFKVGEVLCNCYWRDGSEHEACSFNAANKQLKRLEEKGLKLLAGFEMEYTLYSAKTNKPVFDATEYFSNLMMSESEDYVLQLDHQLESVGIDLECMHTEFGAGQFEMVTRPQWGIKIADDAFIFKEAAKEVATNTGYKAVFMSRPDKEVANNGFHFTLSLWNSKNENVLNGKDGKMSELGNQFLAGLCHHGAALAALCAPTVNCYRRFHNPWAPSSICWAEANRMVAFRTKLYGEKGSCIENRLPSSAANPYLVVAGTLAAGLDGIEKKMSLPPESNHDGDSGTTLPATLDEAMKALQEDKVMVEAIGKVMIDWFVQCKTEVELSALPDFKPKEYDEETLKKEFYLYSRLL